MENFQKDQKVRDDYLGEKMKTKALFLSTFKEQLAGKQKDDWNEELNPMRRKTQRQWSTNNLLKSKK